MTFETLITILTIENLVSWNLCYLTINCDTGQHSQFLRCFLCSPLRPASPDCGWAKVDIAGAGVTNAIMQPPPPPSSNYTQLQNITMQSLCRMHIASDASCSTAQKVNQVCATKRRSCNSTHYPEQQVHHNKTVSFWRQWKSLPPRRKPPQKSSDVMRYILDLQENFFLSLFVKSIRKWTKCTAMRRFQRLVMVHHQNPLFSLERPLKCHRGGPITRQSRISRALRPFMSLEHSGPPPLRGSPDIHTQQMKKHTCWTTLVYSQLWKTTIVLKFLLNPIGVRTFEHLKTPLTS